MRQALGRGLDALIKQAKDDTAHSQTDAVKKIPLSKIIPNRQQPRKVFNEESIQELAESIRKHGLTQPIIVSYDASFDKYEIVAGERRFKACQTAGMSEIDAIVRKRLDPQNMLAVALVENIQREDLNAIDTALAYQKLVKDFGITQNDLAKYCGKSKAAVSNTLRLLELENEIQRAIQSSLISEGHARAILGIPGKTDRTRVFHSIVERKLSVRQVEDLAKKLREGSVPRIESNKAVEVVEIEKQLTEKLGNKVEVKNGKNNIGKLIISYHSLSDFEKITEKLLK